MSGECFQCVWPASKRYTLILDRLTVIEDVFACEACLAGFRETDNIEVQDD